MIGNIYNLRANDIFNGTVLEFVLETDQELMNIDIYSNGKLFAGAIVTPGFNTVEVPLAGDRLEILLKPLGAASLPILNTNATGQEAYIFFTPSNATDLLKYVLYGKKDSGLYQELMQNSIPVFHTNQLNPDLGSGRFEVIGEYEGNGQFNDKLEITKSGSICNWTIADKSGSFVLLEKGQSISLPFGIRLLVLDETEAYLNSAEWILKVGPLPYFFTDKLEKGNWQFNVIAEDLAFNQTVIVGDYQIAIEEVPPFPESFELSKFGDDIKISCRFPITENVLDYKFYTNINPVTGILEPYIIEETPLIVKYYDEGDIESGIYNFETVVTMDTDWNGKLLVRCNAVSMVNKEYFNLDVKEIGYPIHIPQNLEKVGNLIAYYSASDNVTIEFAYMTGRNEPLTDFEIYIATNEEDILTENSPLELSAGSLLEYNIEYYQIDFIPSDYTSFNEPLYIMVRSKANEAYVDSDIIQINIDIDSPDLGTIYYSAL